MISLSETGVTTIGALSRDTGAGEGAGALHRANTEFEAVLLRQLVVAMRKTVPQSETMPASSKLYDHFIEEGLSRHLADVGGIGLADLLALNETVERSTTSGPPEEKPEDSVKSSELHLVARDVGAV